MFEAISEKLFNYFIPKESKILFFTKYSQIEALINSNNPKTFALMYNFRDSIHQILFDSDKIIKLKPNLIKEGLSDLFYLNLLIRSQSDIMNYAYEFDFIEKVNNMRKNTNNCLTIFVFSMIIMELIKNYRESDVYDEENEEEIVNKLYEENKKIRDGVKDVLNNLNLKLTEEYLEDNMISEIYIEIISSLIEDKKLNDYDYCSNILNQIDLKNIELPEYIYNKLLNIFNKNEEYINENKLLQMDDLFNEQKLNFYMTIFVYIFKESIYIYNVNFLKIARNEIIKIVKSDKNNKLGQFIKNKNNSNDKLKEKLSFIIQKFLDTEYYKIKYLKDPKIKIEEVLKYYKNFYFITKEAEINKLENHINDKIIISDNELNDYLSNFDEAKKLNDRKDIIYFLFEEYKGKINKKDKNVQKDMEKYIYKMKDCEKMIKDRKFKKKMRKDDKRLFFRFFDNQNNKDTFLKIFKKEDIDLFMNEMKNEEFYSDFGNNQNNLSQNLNAIAQNLEQNTTDDTENKLKTIDNIKTIGIHQQSADLIIQTKNGDYISMGGSILYLYDENGDKFLEIKNNDKYTCLQEIPNLGKDEIELIATTQKELSIIKINKKSMSSNNESYLKKKNIKFCLPIDKDNHIIFLEEGVHHFKNIFNKIIAYNSTQISEDNCIGGIKISQNLIAITSNKNIRGGKDSIMFYNPSIGKIFKEIEEYSFINSVNGLTLLTSEENNQKENTILLCACKKNVLNGQKNGILLINIDDEKNFEVQFYETGNFEVYSFCPLSTFGNKKTNYFLVGGYDNIKEKGDIKLYEKIMGKNEIKLVYNLSFEKNQNNAFEDFNGSIKCITQSKDKKILITCSDGKVYLFSEPDLEFDIKNEETNWVIFLNDVK